jgi:hypothetical protein
MGGRLWAKAREGGGSEFGFALRRYTDEDDPVPGTTPGTTTANGATVPRTPHEVLLD